MRKFIILFLELMFIILLYSCDAKKSNTDENNSSNVESSNLDLKPPGMVAEPFDSEIFTQKGYELEGVFHPEMEEFYFTTSQDAPFLPKVIVFRKSDNAWRKYDFFSTDSADDDILFSRFHYIERTDSGWTKMKSLSSMFDREDWGIMRLSASAKGTYVFDDYRSNDVIRISTIKNGKREEPKLLGEEINTGKWTAHPFIAPDESYLIWDSEREGGYGGTDIYISFKQQDGSWGSAINLGKEVNTSIDENTARLTVDGKYLFFWRAEEKVNEDGSTYWESSRQWVDARIIENLRFQK